MTAFDVFFYLFALITLSAAAITVFSRKIVYAAFSLLFAFGGVAGIYVLLGADFLAITQVLVYVGGVLVLIVFGIMLTTDVMDAAERPLRKRLGSLGISLLIGAGLIVTLLSTSWTTYHDQPWASSTWKSDHSALILTRHTSISGVVEQSSGTARELGTLLMTDYLLPFELVSILLLVALIGAAYLARPQGVPIPPDVAMEQDTTDYSTGDQV